MNVAGYVRVSTSEQVESGAGLDAQRRALREEAQRRGWVLALYEDAGASGKSLSGRPGLQAALAAVEGGHADALAVAKLDRLSRSLLDFASIVERARKRGWNLVCLDIGIDLSTPAGGMLDGAEVVAGRVVDAVAVDHEIDRRGLTSQAQDGRSGHGREALAVLSPF